MNDLERAKWCQDAAVAQTELERFYPALHELTYTGTMKRDGKISQEENDEKAKQIKAWYHGNKPLPEFMTK